MFPSDVVASIAVMNGRHEKAALCVNSLLHQTVPPTKVYLWISRSSYMLDQGFSEIPGVLQNLMESTKGTVEIRFTENTGPYRKLLPLVKKINDENPSGNDRPIILTCDDEHEYSKDMIESMLADAKTYFNDKRTCNFVVSNKAFIADYSKNRYPDTTYGPSSIYSAKETVNSSKILLPLGSFGVMYFPDMYQGEFGTLDTWKLSSPTFCDPWFAAWAYYKGSYTIITDSSKKFRKDGDIDLKQYACLSGLTLKKTTRHLRFQTLIDCFHVLGVPFKQEWVSFENPDTDVKNCIQSPNAVKCAEIYRVESLDCGQFDEEASKQ